MSQAIIAILVALIAFSGTYIGAKIVTSSQRRLDRDKWLREKRALCAEKILDSMHKFDTYLIGLFTGKRDRFDFKLEKFEFGLARVYLRLYFPKEQGQEIADCITSMGKLAMKDQLLRQDMDEAERLMGRATDLLVLHLQVVESDKNGIVDKYLNKLKLGRGIKID